MPDPSCWKASLPMYDFPEMGGALSRYWNALRAELIERGIGTDGARALPGQLLRSTHLADPQTDAEPVEFLWKRADLIFSQTCGYPYVSHLREHVSLIGTPDYGLVSGKPGWYHSVVVVRSDDPRDRLEQFENSRFVFNALDSQSGCQAMMYQLLRCFGEHRFFGSCIESGAHVASIQSVAKGDADLAAIDGVTWRFAQRYLAVCGELRVLMRTEPTPGLPYITACRTSGLEFADAVECAIRKLASSDRHALGLEGLWRSGPEDYELIKMRARVAVPVLLAHMPVCR